MVQRLGLCPSNAGNVDLIPGWGNKIPQAAWQENLKKKAKKKKTKNWAESQAYIMFGYNIPSGRKEPSGAET